MQVMTQRESTLQLSGRVEIQAQAFVRLGSQLAILARGTLLSREDPALGEGLAAAFRAEGIDVRQHTQERAARFAAGQFILGTDDGSIQGDGLLVAAGRAPNTQDLALDKVGIATDESGTIVVDTSLHTSAEPIYATGDCTTLPQFIYVAAAGGTRAVINMTGRQAELNLSAMPTVIFTEPQVATVGLDEGQARLRGIEIETRTLGLEYVPRALANFETVGFVKLVAQSLPAGCPDSCPRGR